MIERYSKRRFTTSGKSSSSAWFSSSKSTSLWPAWSALSPVSDSKNWVFEHLGSLFGLSARRRVQSAAQEWLNLMVFYRIFCSMVTNLASYAYLSCIWASFANLLSCKNENFIFNFILLLLFLTVASWMVKQALHCCFGCGSIVFTTRINRDLRERNAEEKSCWSVIVYLICTGNVFKIRQAILSEIDAEPSLTLTYRTKLMGMLQIWRRCQDADVGCYSLVRELSPVWNRELVTQDTVHVSKQGRKSEAYAGKQSILFRAGLCHRRHRASGRYGVCREASLESMPHSTCV